MPQIKNIFTQGRMNSDVDERLIPEGEYIRGLNIFVSKTESGEAGAIENSLPNAQLTNIDFGTNAEGIGIANNEFTENIYWFVVSDSGSYVIEWDNRFGVATPVLIDTRPPPNNILNFSRNQEFRITGINIIIDTDNGDEYLAWTDNLNPPRFINIERAQSYGENNFGQDEISLIKRPPINSPTLELSETDSTLENNIEGQFLLFSYRYIYLDGERSALSPFSEVGFLPRRFLYDFGMNSNESMINSFSLVNITFNTGSNLITDVELVFKSSDNDAVFLIETLNKAQQGWVDNTDQTVPFSNNKVYSQLDSFQLGRRFDNVPLTAKSQEIIGSRLVYGNYSENYDLINASGESVFIDMTLALNTTPIDIGIPTRTLKSNRDYEIGIIYLDDYARSTTVLTSDTNTIYIPNINSITQNQIVATIGNTAPSFARYFRFVVKQFRVDYDTIVPTSFFEDGIFVWVFLQGGDVNKVNAGDFLWVKSDTSGILEDIVQTKVLEIVTQPVNFLEESTVTTIEQPAGIYMKVQPRGYTLNRASLDLFQFSGYSDSRNSVNKINSPTEYVDLPVYYGENGLDDLVLESDNSYAGSEDIRYIVDIDSIGVPDTFRWSDDNGATFTSNVAITGANQPLNNDIVISFDATTGHQLSDNWIISAKAAMPQNFGDDEESKAYSFFPGPPVPNEVILGGAQISIFYNESGEETQRVSRSYISTRNYANLEEWFFMDNIDADLQDQGIPVFNRIFFRRGTFSQDEGVAQITITPILPEGSFNTMIIRSNGTQNNSFDGRAEISFEIDIFQSEFNVLFETVPEVNNSAPYYEIGRTYEISPEGFHLAFDDGDTSQTAVTNGVFTLPLFNAFAWGNGFESIKIRDAFNATTFLNQTRAVESVENYRRNVRIADLTYSQPFNQETNFNALNEFNLTRANFFTLLDDEDGSVQKLYARDTNLLVFQEDKDLVVPFGKDIIFDAEGDTDVAISDNVLGTPRAYAGDFGISTHPESFAVYGHQIWHTDQKRGAVVRLSVDGLSEVSNYGMRTFFRDYFRDNPNSPKIGAYDPYHDQYVLHLKEDVDSGIPNFGCGASLFRLNQTQTFNYTLTLNDLPGDITLTYNIVSGTITIVATFNGMDNTAANVTGMGNLTFERTTLDENLVSVSVTSITPSSGFQITNTCPSGIGAFDTGFNIGFDIGDL